MTVLKEIAEIRYMTRKMGVELEMVCLNKADVKQLGNELINVVGSLHDKAIASMVVNGIIPHSIRVLGVNVVSLCKEATPIDTTISSCWGCGKQYT